MSDTCQENTWHSQAHVGCKVTVVEEIWLCWPAQTVSLLKVADVTSFSHHKSCNDYALSTEKLSFLEVTITYFPNLF